MYGTRKKFLNTEIEPHIEALNEINVDRGSRTPKVSHMNLNHARLPISPYRHIFNFHLRHWELVPIGETVLSHPSISLITNRISYLHYTQNVTFSHLLLFANGVLAISTKTLFPLLGESPPRRWRERGVRGQPS